MFDNLIGSDPGQGSSPPVGGTLTPLVLHGALVLGAVQATMSRETSVGPIAADTTMVIFTTKPRSEPSEPKVPQPVSTLVTQVPFGFRLIDPPSIVPAEIPPVDMTVDFDPRKYKGVGDPDSAFDGVLDHVGTDFGQTFLEPAVDERPQRISGRIETIEGWARESIAAPRFRAGLLTAFGGLALLLALLGVYVVMSYSVTQRRKEMAVRIALGAQRRDIVGMLTGEGLRFVVAGQVLGLAAALALTRLVEELLFGVSTRDAAVFTIVSVALAGVVMLTSYIPARRAGLVRPVEALRE